VYSHSICLRPLRQELSRSKVQNLMGYDLYLSYSGRKSYMTCPKKYHFMYVLRDKTRGDRRNTFFGSIIGKVYEWFYSRRAWATADPVATVVSYVEDATRSVYEKEDFDPVTDPAFVNLLQQDLRKYVPEGVEIIRKHGLLSAQSLVEADLTIEYTSPKHGLNLKIGGRSDFTHVKGDKDTWLLDGKASKHKEKYADSEQLIWYAIQHYLKYHIAPSRLGFIFWCFPEDPVKWIAYDNNVMRASLDKTFEVAKKIHLKQFDATPSGECHRCDFITKCEDGQKYLAKRKVETGGRIENSIFDLEQV
jgi:hypothetical protein